MKMRLVLAAVLSSLIPCLAQTSASLVGTVRDPSGAVVPNTRIVVSNLQTSATRTVTSNVAGDYVITNLPIGSYSLTAEAPGFKRFEQSPIVLQVDQTGRIDVLLEQGQVTETVTVTGTPPVIDSEKSGIGAVIENQTIVQLPLNGRNFLQLGSLVPGATEGAPGNSVVRSREGGLALTANGQRAEYNNYMLDGLDNNETLFGVAVVVPSIDAIQEFKVETSNYSAEYGRGSGAIVNVAIKSGTNDLHGSFYDFLRNDVLDARNTFSSSKTPLRRNQYGLAVGGPVYLPYWFGHPGLYRGRNRTFWFFNWEVLKQRQSATQFLQVPTAAQRQGDFTGLPTIFDPFSLDTNGNRVAFLNNRIAAPRLSPIAQKVLDSYPLPNTNAAAGNYAQVVNNPTDNNQINVRGDQMISSSDQLFIRYSRTNSTQLTPSINFNSGNTTINSQGGVVGYTKILSPKIVNELKIGVQRYIYDLLPEGLGTNGAATLDLPYFSTDPLFLRYPSISISNIAGYGGQNSIPLYRVESTYQLIDGLSWTLGRHSIKLGTDVRVYHANNLQPQFSSGSYSFTGVFTGAIGKSYANGLADFLLGLPATQQILNPTGYDATRLRNTRVNPYIQDDFQVSDRLTLNLGLRWEYDGSWREVNNRFAYFDFATGQAVYPQDANIPFKTFPYPYRFENIDSLKRPSTKQFAPRVGFAFRPFGDNKTVLRSAYGIFWAQPIANVMLNAAFTPPPYQLTQTLTSGAVTPQLQFGVFPGIDASTLIPRNPTFFTLNPATYQNGYVQQWNFGIERQLVPSVGLSISYVGSKGTHLEGRREGNPALPPGPGAVNPRRLYPAFQGLTYQTSDFFSTYHALQVSAEKRYSNGLLFLASYTYSKSIDNASGWTGNDTGGGSVPEDPSRLFLEKGRSAFDLRQRFTLAASYDIPFKSGQRVLNALLHGWQASGLLTLQTGFPFSISVPGDVANAATGYNRANLTGDPFLSNPSPRAWFNTDAFGLPSAYTFGTSGRNVLSGPGTKNLDFSVQRLFRITERAQLQFRAEFFDVANHPNYGMPNTSFGNSALGTISSASNRISQMGLKLLF